MALLAEELVEEWLNRKGYFTIRGIKTGVHEMDLLAVRSTGGGLECRHLEVQVSINAVSYFTDLSREHRTAGRRASSQKERTPEELQLGVREWIARKFEHKDKLKVMRQLAPGPWSRELVVHKVLHEEELELLMDTGIKIWRLSEVLADLSRDSTLFKHASGGDLMNLVLLGGLIRES